MPDSPLFTEAEAAAHLRISEQTLRNARYRHRVAYFKYGSEVRYSQKHLDDYTQRCEKKAQGQVVEPIAPVAPVIPLTRQSDSARRGLEAGLKLAGRNGRKA